MRSTAKRKTQREAARGKRQMYPEFSGEEEDTEIVFHPSGPAADPSPPAPLSPPDSPDSSAEIQCGVALDMVQKINSQLGLITLDNDKIRTVCEKLLQDNKDRDRDLTGVVKRSLDRPLEHLPQQDAFKPDDSDGNLRATDIGITWDQLRRHYQPVREHGGCNMSTPRQPPTLPTCLQILDTCTPLRRNNPEGRQGYRPIALIQRFNNKSLNWPSWF